METFISFDIELYAKFRTPGELIQPMNFPPGFSFEQRNFKVFVIPSKILLSQKDQDEYIEKFDINALKRKIATSECKMEKKFKTDYEIEIENNFKEEFGIESESEIDVERYCYEYEIKLLTIKFVSCVQPDFTLVSESNLIEFINGSDNLNHLILIS